MSSPIDELSSTLGEINATLRSLKERMTEAAADQTRREDNLYRDLRAIKDDNRAIEKSVTALDQKVGNIDRQLLALYQPEPVSTRVQKLEECIQDLNKERWRATGVLLTVSVFAAALSNWLIHLFTGLFNGPK